MERKVAADVAATAADFLCPEVYGDRFPLGMLSVLAGWPGAGKSSFSRQLVATVSLDSKAAMCQTEDADGAVRLALEIAGADLSNIEFIEPDLQHDVAGFCEYIRAEQPAIITLDPIAAMFGGLIYQEAEFRLLFKPIKEALEETGCALIGIHHTIGNVRKNDHPLKALGGPQGSLKGTARSIWLFGASPEAQDSERVLAHVKDNCGTTKDALVLELGFEDQVLPGRPLPVKVPQLSVLDLEAKFTAQDLLHFNADDAKAKEAKQSVAGEFLAEVLILGELPQKMVFDEAKLLGISRPAVQRAALALKIVKRADEATKQVCWRLPDDHPGLIGSVTDEEISDFFAGQGDV